jgi:hypothetical protein
MATEKPEPRTGLILRIGALAVVTLVVVHAALVAYYDKIATAEEQRKIGEVKPESLLNLRADEKSRLDTGPLPIEKAMQDIATKGRNANPAIVPTASKDTAPLGGWQQMPQQLPPGAMVPPPPPPAATVDAGAAAAAGDGGALTNTNRPDGGPSKAPPGGHPRHP